MSRGRRFHEEHGENEQWGRFQEGQVGNEQRGRLHEEHGGDEQGKQVPLGAWWNWLVGQVP